MTHEDIEKRFAYHPPKEGHADRYKEIRFNAKTLAYSINVVCPESREKSLAVTHLEQVVFWANAAIARNE